MNICGFEVTIFYKGSATAISLILRQKHTLKKENKHVYKANRENTDWYGHIKKFGAGQDGVSHHYQQVQCNRKKTFDIFGQLILQSILQNSQCYTEKWSLKKSFFSIKNYFTQIYLYTYTVIVSLYMHTVNTVNTHLLPLYYPSPNFQPISLLFSCLLISRSHWD